jgi:8-oxo-dGTP diphosphatase
LAKISQEKPLDKVFATMLLCVYKTLTNSFMAKVEKKFKFTVLATDVVIFTIKDNKLQVLLIKMKKDPFTSHWAVPGGLVNPQESLEKSAQKQLLLKSGLKGVYLEQLYTFGKINRDPFGRVVSVAYFALVPSENLALKTSQEYAGVDWFGVDKLPQLAYDHAEIIALAKERLQAKLGYTNIIYSLLPKRFSLGDLQSVYEIILGKKIDKRNFRKKIFALKLVKKTGEERRGDAFRPAELYKFVSRRPAVVQIL